MFGPNCSEQVDSPFIIKFYRSYKVCIKHEQAKPEKPPSSCSVVVSLCECTAPAYKTTCVKSWFQREMNKGVYVNKSILYST
eukprot:4127548-Amphidinium_carterae.1